MLGMDREDSNTSMCILKLHVFRYFAGGCHSCFTSSGDVFELPLNN